MSADSNENVVTARLAVASTLTLRESGEGGLGLLERLRVIVDGDPGNLRKLLGVWDWYVKERAADNVEDITEDKAA